MAKKLVCLRNFHCSDLVPNQKDEGRLTIEWKAGDEYSGKDDLERLMAEGLVGYEQPKKAEKKIGPALEEGEAMSVSGEEVEEVVPADGSDGEEPAEEPKRGKAKKK